MDLSHGGGKGYDAINELMRAMVLRVVDDFNSIGELHDEAVEYMMDDDEEYLFSFYSICKHMNLDPVKTRNKIMYAESKISTRRRAA